ncbi:MAG: heme-binding protein [Alphaproteobacteria bacterium]|uniref:GlcG/HbpS family heme-binding protein n=1 Tax=Marinobacter salarius TaxID=1420917 RepID=UPI0032EB3F3C
MARISLDLANQIIDHARKRSRELKYRPASVAVVDDGGHLIAYGREEGVGLVRAHIAINKAWSSVAYGVGTRAIGENLVGFDHWLIGAADMVPGHRLITSAGGVLIQDQNGVTLGGAGVANVEDDEGVAAFAVEAVGLVAFVGMGEHG